MGSAERGGSGGQDLSFVLLASTVMRSLLLTGLPKCYGNTKEYIIQTRDRERDAVEELTCANVFFQE